MHSVVPLDLQSLCTAGGCFTEQAAEGASAVGFSPCPLLCLWTPAQDHTYLHIGSECSSIPRLVPTSPQRSQAETACAVQRTAAPTYLRCSKGLESLTKHGQTYWPQVIVNREEVFTGGSLPWDSGFPDPRIPPWTKTEVMSQHMGVRLPSSLGLCQICVVAGG